MTGIVGANRDILGTGLGARPTNTDVFCFGPSDWDKPLPRTYSHPSRVLRGVHAGVRVGGNESGIPTVNGAIVFDSRFVGKPLVYCGGGPNAKNTPGWAPISCKNSDNRRLGLHGWRPCWI